MGFFSDIWDGIKEVASTAWSGIKTAVSAVAEIGKSASRVAGSLVSSIASLVPTVGRPFGGLFSAVSAVLNSIAITCGIFKKEEKIEDMGEKALEGAEQNIHPENFDTPVEYVEKIREVPLSDDRLKYTPMERKLAGMSVAALALEYKEDIAPETYALFVKHEDFFDDKRTEDYTQYAIKNGISLSKIMAFFSTNSTLAERREAEKLLYQAEQSRDPNFDPDKFEVELHNTLLRKE